MIPKEREDKRQTYTNHKVKNEKRANGREQSSVMTQAGAIYR